MSAKKQTTNKTLGAIAKEHGITRNTLAAWQAEGVNIHDPKAMRERAAVKHSGGGKVDGGTEMQQARLRKLRAEARSAEMKAQEMEGKVIALDEVEAAFTRLGAVVKAQLLKLQSDLPPVLVGMGEGEMQRRIAAHVEAVLQSLHDPEGVPWK
jgi:hypothetical protein